MCTLFASHSVFLSLMHRFSDTQDSDCISLEVTCEYEICDGNKTTSYVQVHRKFAVETSSEGRKTRKLEYDYIQIPLECSNRITCCQLDGSALQLILTTFFKK